MSSKTTTTTSNQYNNGAMGNYNMFQGQLGNSLMQMANNPLTSSFFNQQYGMARAQASQVGQRNMSNILNNVKTGGGILGNSGSFLQSQINRASLGNSVLGSNAFNTSLNGALSSRNFALAGMEGYTPLQTGQTTTQQQSQGWGSILGSIAGMGLNMAMPGLGSMLGGGSFSGGYQANPGSSGVPQASMNLFGAL
jgi:hypothetical protein